MTISNTDLMGKVYDLLSETYAAGSNDKAFLAFESMGVGVSDSMFKVPPDPTYCAPLAVERLSQIANFVPVIHDGLIAHGLHTVEAVAGMMLESAAPINADAMPSLGHAKLEGGRKFDQTLASAEGIPDYAFRPVFATPTDWFDASSKNNWSLHTVGQQEESGPPKAPPRFPVPVGMRPTQPPVWRVLPVPLRTSVSKSIELQHPALELVDHANRPPAASIQLPPLVGQRPAMTVRQLAAPTVATLASRQISTLGIGIRSLPVAQVIRPAEVALATDALVKSSSSQTVVSQSVSISFEHCIVELTRRWLPDDLMLLQNWYLPNYAKGDVSNGLGERDTGLMPVLPTAFVAIRNLRISAQWSETDLAVADGSAAFGPFALMGRTFDAASGTLVCPGIQIIGWFCSALPVLPPLSDPELSKETPSQPVAAPPSAVQAASTLAAAPS